jgi:ABC-2 type transport system ATP-binding protein
VRSARETGAVTDIARERGAVVVARDLRVAHKAVRGIDLDVRGGEVFALVGPTGAGKTTIVEVLAGLRPRTAGDVSVLGSDPASAGPDWRARITVVPQASGPEPGLARSARHLSEGQRRSVEIALALARDRDLILLDAPTAGLDRVARRSAWSVVAGARELGKTVFVATDSMGEADVLADRIAILAAGRIVATGTRRTLRARAATSSRISFDLPPKTRVGDLPEPARVGAVVDDARRVTLRSTVPMAVLGALAPWAQEHGSPLRDIEVRRPSLEDFYHEMTVPPR